MCKLQTEVLHNWERRYGGWRSKTVAAPFRNVHATSGIPKFSPFSISFEFTKFTSVSVVWTANRAKSSHNPKPAMLTHSLLESLTWSCTVMSSSASVIFLRDGTWLSGFAFRQLKMTGLRRNPWFSFRQTQLKFNWFKLTPNEWHGRWTFFRLQEPAISECLFLWPGPTNPDFLWHLWIYLCNQIRHLNDSSNSEYSLVHYLTVSLWWTWFMDGFK